MQKFNSYKFVSGNLLPRGLASYITLSLLQPAQLLLSPKVPLLTVVSPAAINAANKEVSKLLQSMWLWPDHP